MRSATASSPPMEASPEAMLIRSPVLRAFRSIPLAEITEESSEDFLTHGGMLKCALSAFHKTVQQIYELKFYPTYNKHDLVVCGHSLGGSVASPHARATTDAQRAGTANRAM